MSFVTAVNCIDGQAQAPVSTWLRRRYGVRWVDAVTDAAPASILADESESAAGECISARVHFSLDVHGSGVVALVAHHGCRANPVGEAEQRRQLRDGVRRLGGWFPDAEVIGLWLDAAGEVHPV